MTVRTPDAPRSAFRELSSASAKELVRNRKGSFSIVFMVGFLFALIVGLNFAVNVADRPAPVVALSGDGDAVARAQSSLEAAGIRIDPAAANVAVEVSAAGARVTLDVADPPRWFDLVREVERSGVDAPGIRVTDSTGFAHLDLVRANLATIAAVGIMAVAFMGTALPIVVMRERGTLRMLGTTPVRKLTFIAAQTPVRAVATLAIGVAVAGIAVAMGYLAPGGVVSLAVTVVLGTLMFFSFAYLLASRSRSPELINAVSVLLPIAVMFASGDVFPKQVLPDWLAVALDWLPSSWFIQAASADLAGMPPVAPVPILWLLMAACTAAVALAAARLFSWDDRER